MSRVLYTKRIRVTPTFPLISKTVHLPPRSHACTLQMLGHRSARSLSLTLTSPLPHALPLTLAYGVIDSARQHLPSSPCPPPIPGSIELACAHRLRIHRHHTRIHQRTLEHTQYSRTRRIDVHPAKQPNILPRIFHTHTLASDTPNSEFSQHTFH